MLPEYIFENKLNVESIKSETPEVSIVDKVVFDKGIFVYYQGAEYPQKGLSSPEIISSINIIKASIIELLKIRFNYISFFSAFDRIGMKILGQYFLKNEYRSVQMLELCRGLYHFAFYLTANDFLASQFSKIVSHIIEYDNAYRLRFIDIASEINKDSLIKSPKKEVFRLLSVAMIRDRAIRNKLQAIKRALYLVLSIPSIKKAIVYAVKNIDVNNMKYDNIDKYWACLRTDYDFMGLSNEDRRSLIHNAGYSIPTLVKNPML